METRSKKIKRADFCVLDTLMRDLPEVFESQVLSKLDVKDHVNLALVNKECRDTIYNLEPLLFLRLLRYAPEPMYMFDSISTRRKKDFLERQYYAGKAGRVDVLKWLWEHGYQYVSADTVAAAAIYGHKHVFDWLCELPHDVREFDLPRPSYEDTLQTARVVDITGACSGAAVGGHLELLKFLVEQGFPAVCPTSDDYNYGVSRAAAEYGHINILQWVLDNHIEDWDEQVCRHAAGGGKLDTLKWLRANGCPWGASTCKDAVEGNHLQVLQWAHENGCPWNESAFIAVHTAIGPDRSPLPQLCVQYLIQKRCPGWEKYTRGGRYYSIYSMSISGTWDMERYY